MPMLRISRIAAVLGLVPLAAIALSGCGGGSASPPAGNHSTETATKARGNDGYASQYPSEYRNHFFRSRQCGEGDAACECELNYVEAHVPYSWLEEGSGQYAATEEEMDAGSEYCHLKKDQEEHTGYEGDSEAKLIEIAHELVKKS